MLYTEFINKAIDLTICEADNGLFYLEPLWRNILYDNKFNVTDISDAVTDWAGIFDVLKLEVEKRNIINSKKPAVINWLYEVISAQIEPAMLQEETDFVKQVTEFMKTNHESQTIKEEEWDNFKNT